jgi:hypothetical protein
VIGVSLRQTMVLKKQKVLKNGSSVDVSTTQRCPLLIIV